MRQPIRGYVQPAEPVHTITLVTSDTPESISEGAAGWAQPPDCHKASPSKVLEGERRGHPVLHICESKAEKMCSSLMLWRKAGRPLKFWRIVGLRRSQEAPRNRGLESARCWHSYHGTSEGIKPGPPAYGSAAAHREDGQE